MDYQVFKMINDLSGKNAFLDGFMKFMTTYGPYIFVIVLAALFLNWRSKSWREQGLTAAASLAVALGFSFIIGQLWTRTRPFVAHEDVNVLLYHAPDASFPSDHTTGAFAIAFGIWFVNKRLGGIMLFLAVLVGFSRPYVGHHYPGDVLAGILVAFIAAFIVQAVMKRLNVTSKEAHSSRAAGR